ncbi:hypothetical protein D3C80_1598280 [compost metagenome]
MSGEERGCTLIHCRSWLASDGGLPAGQISRMHHSPEGAGGSKAEGELTLGLMSGEKRGGTPINCRSWLASDGGLTAGLISRMYHSVGAAEGCDLLILPVKNRVKRSQPRCTRQLLQGNTHASETGRSVGSDALAPS